MYQSSHRVGAALGLLGLLASIANVTTTRASSTEPPIPPLADVPEYRGGPDRTGVFPGPPIEEQPLPLWTRSTPTGIAFNSILGDGVLVIGDQAGHLYGLDARIGDEQWRVDGKPVVSSSPSYADGIVTYEDGDHVLHAIDVHTAAERWSARIDNVSGGDAPSGTEIADGVVYIGDGSHHLLGFDLATGKQTFSADAPGGVGIATVSGDTAYTTIRGGSVAAISTSDGSVRWQFQTISQVAGVTIVTDDTVFVAALDAQSAEPVGELDALDRSTGAVRWRFRGDSGDQISLGAVDGDSMYAGSASDGLFAFQVHPPQGGTKTLWRSAISQKAWKNAALSGGVLYFPVGDPSGVVAVRASDGTVLWTIPLQGDAQGILASGGELFVADSTGTISAYASRSLAGAFGQVASGRLSSPAVAAAPAPDTFTLIRTLTPSATGLAPISGLAVGPDGRLYVIDVDNRLVVIDPVTGKPVGGWGSKGTEHGQFDFTATDGNPGYGAVAVGRDGRVYIGDGNNHRYQVFSSDGTFQRQVGSFGSRPGQFSRIFQIAVDDANNVYAVDMDLHTVQSFDSKGEFRWLVGGTAAEAPLTGTFHEVVPTTAGTLLVSREDVPVLELDAGTGAYIRQRTDLPASIVQMDASGDIFSASGDPPATISVFAPSGQMLCQMTRDLGNWAFRLTPDGKLVTWRDATLTIFDPHVPGVGNPN